MSTTAHYARVNHSCCLLVAAVSSVNLLTRCCHVKTDLSECCTAQPLLGAPSFLVRPASVGSIQLPCFLAPSCCKAVGLVFVFVRVLST